MTGSHPDLFGQRARPFDGDPFGDGVSRATRAGLVAAYFTARPGQWIDGRELMSIAGAYGWRTRISDVRRAPYHLRIDNRQRRVGRSTVSEYRLVVESPTLDGAA